MRSLVFPSDGIRLDLCTLGKRLGPLIPSALWGMPSERRDQWRMDSVPTPMLSGHRLDLVDRKQSQFWFLQTVSDSFALTFWPSSA